MPTSKRNRSRSVGKTIDMSDQAGTAMFPKFGAEVTLFYEEQDGKNVVTRIGQAQQ